MTLSVLNDTVAYDLSINAGITLDYTLTRVSIYSEEMYKRNKKKTHKHLIYADSTWITMLVDRDIVASLKDL